MKKIMTVFVALLVVLAAGVGISAATFDIDTYRPQIIEALSKETGRAIKLGGPVKFSLSSQGLVLGIQDAAIGNPDWASRPAMAGIGRFQLSVALLPLLDHRLVVTGLAIENANILLESASGDRHNWDFVRDKNVPAADKGHTATSASPVAIHIDRVSVMNSQLAIRDEDGKTTIFKTGSLILGSELGGLGLHFKGEYNGLPIALNINTSADDFMSKARQAVEADMTFADMQMKARGKASLGDRKADFDSYELSAGKSGMHGRLAVSWDGPHPTLQGTVESDHLAPADFKMPETANVDGNDRGAKAPSGPEHVFSDTPLGLDTLRAVDANLDIAIAEMPMSVVSLKHLTARLSLAGGRLSLAPIRAVLGGGIIDGQVALDGSGSPARVALAFKAAGVDLSSMLELWGIEAFLSGKADADMNLAGYGDSPHAIAGSMTGTINVVSAGGDVVSSASGRISSGLTELLAPGSSNGMEGMNCMVARFIAANGVVKDNGILVDTAASTVAGRGSVNLHDEALDITLNAKPKAVDIGGLLPALHVGGTLSHPGFNLSAAGAMQNVMGMLTNGPVGDSGVPTVTAQQGQNACLYTLNHLTASNPPSQGGLMQELAGKAKEVGGKLKSLLGVQ